MEYSETIDEAKAGSPVMLRFKLKNVNVYASTNGYTFTKIFDVENSENYEVSLTSKQFEDIDYYVRQKLESNHERFQNQMRLVSEKINISKPRLLDIGCGGGEFLIRAKRNGYLAVGLELNANRAAYSRKRTGVAIHQKDIVKLAIDQHSTYDCVTLWDVIEHVNWPLATLQGVHNVLKDGGYVFLDTPAKDSFYHQFSEVLYRVSFGKLAGFLNIMYDSTPYGHKQIFSTAEIVTTLKQAGFKNIEVKKFHELSFPIEHYLTKIFQNKKIVNNISPIIKHIIVQLKIVNKMYVVAKKIES